VVPPGGAAAIYGFLFQILRTAEWALKIDLEAPERDAMNVTIIAEPPAGDIDIRFPQGRLVQQFKARDDGTWSLAEIVDKTMPDLYRVVADDQEKVRYQFVTSGRIGEWAPAYEFFRSLASRDPGNAPLESLDASNHRFLLRGKYFSERSLFEEIIRVLREHQPAKAEEEATTHRKLWHRLSRFEFVTTGDLAEAEGKVRSLVSAYVADDGLLDDKVARLRDTVLAYAASGNRSFTPAELLREAGIEGTAFTKLPVAHATVRELTLADMRRLIGYNRSLSVRSPYKCEEWGHILVFSGESGQGKSWCLADVAYDLMDRGQGGLVVFVSASGNLTADLTTAAHRVVRDALGHNTAASFEQLTTHIKKTLPGLRDPWLTICLDDVSSSAEIIELCGARLDEWGIRVALTAGPRLARHEMLKEKNAIIEAVQDFSESELREFLVRNGRSWAVVPPDVRKTMRRPLLATIFVREAARWSPKTEYELYEACWRRLSTVREQPEHPDDLAAMLALAEDLSGGGQYPWSLKSLRTMKIDGAQQVRLEAIGWLRVDDHGAASIWHDRLLNWAVAENVAEEAREIAGNAAAIGTLLKRFWDEGDTNDGKHRRLTYVPMDVLWICASRNGLSAGQLAAVIENLEPSHLSDSAGLYSLLASLGPCIVPALAQRLRKIGTEPDDSGLEMNVRRAILSALQMDGGKAVSHVLEMLEDSSPRLRDIGIRAAGVLPAGLYAPILWNLLVEHDVDVEKASGESTHGNGAHWKRDRIYRALAGSVSHAHEWLENQIVALESPNDDAVTFAWLLSSLATARGRLLWQKVKDKLFEFTPLDKPRGLIACIQNYHDAYEVPRLETWLSWTHDFAAPSSLGALALVAPEKALAFVITGAASIVSDFASWWLPWLMLTRREETLASARERLSYDASVAEWFRGSEHELDAVTIDGFIEHLSGQMLHFVSDSGSVSERHFQWSAHVLAAAGHSIGVDRLSAQSGTDFERNLVAAVAHLPLKETPLTEPSVDLRMVLRRVNEKAMIEALIAALNGEDLTATEIDWAIAYPTPEVVEALRAFVLRKATKENEKWLSPKAVRAVRALALIGDDEGVVDAVWLSGSNIVDDDVAWLVREREPMNETLVARLLDALSSPDETERVRALASLGVSRRRDLIPRILDEAASPKASLTVRYHAISAARDLVERGTEIADLVESVVNGNCNDLRHVLAELLIASGTPASMNLLAVLARKLPFDHVRDEAIVECLVDRSDTGREMAALLQSHLWPFPYAPTFGNRADAWGRLFPVIADDELRQKALDSALLESNAIDSLVVIECVATFDRAAAFDLVVAALKSERKGREVLPAYLLKFDLNRAADALVSHLCDESVALVRWAICRALRWSGDQSFAARIHEMAGGRSVVVREAAYDYAGWHADIFKADDLREAALNDESFDVRIAARDAIRRRHRIRQTAELRERLIASSGSEAWMYAETLITYGDPYLLSRHEDELCVWPALQTFPAALQAQAQKWLHARSKKIEREAETEDFFRGRSGR
jgi:hypothetical protein